MDNKKLSQNSLIFILEDGRLAGPQIYLFRLVKKLQIESRIIFPLSGKDYKDLLDSSDLRNSQVFLCSPSLRLFRFSIYFLTFIPEVIFLTFYFLFSKENIVYAGGGAWQIKGVLAAKLSFKKVIWHLNDTKMPFPVKIIFFFLSRLADGFIFASEASEKYYCNLIPKKPTSVIPSPVDKEIPRNKSKLNLVKPDKRIIGMVANVNPIKNFEDFLYVASNLNNKYDDLQFVIIGPIYETQIDYYKKLQVIISELNLKNISFVGAVENVFEYLEEFDIFLFTSSSESSPLAVWEAMLSSCPIVTYDVGDISRYITHLDTGYISELKDVKGLEKGVSLLLDNVDLATSMGRKAKRIAETELSSQSCADLHLDYFNKLL